MSGGATGPQVSFSLRGALERAKAEATTLGDDYIASEHLLLGVIEEPGASRDVARRALISRDALLDALKALRGGRRVTDANAEETYEALERFAIDLTAAPAPARSTR